MSNRSKFSVQSVIGLCSIAGCLFAIIQAIANESLPVLSLAAVLFLGSIIVWGTAWYRCALLRWVYLHRDQDSAHLSAPFYKEIIAQDIRRLRLNEYELACRVGIPRWVARHLMENPSDVLRPDLWRKLEEAVLRPERSFERRRKHDRRSAIKRLRRYSDIGIRAWTIAEAATQPTSAIIAEVERIEYVLDLPEEHLLRKEVSTG